MEELIKKMNVKQLIELINDCADAYSSRFPYIMDNDDSDKWDEIEEYMGAYMIASAVSNGRFNASDKWLIVVDDAPKIFTFSDKETLFSFLNPKQIADLFKENGIKLSVRAKKRK